MSVLYNDNDQFVCAWLRELIADGYLPAGDVFERDIRGIKPEELAATCHFFAGIGGWPYALRLAGWPDDRPVWTASLPCPSFSAAGKRRGVDDPRHLWPAFYALVAQCKPPVIFGEQVEGAIGFGWLDGIFADLERSGYAVGAAVLPAAGVGAPHIRSRLFWVADANTDGSGTCDERMARARTGCRSDGEIIRQGSGNGGMALTASEQMGRAGQPRQCAADGRLADADGGHSSAERLQRGGRHGQFAADEVAADGLGHANGAGREAFQPIAIGAEARSEQSTQPSLYDGLAESAGARRSWGEERRSLDGAASGYEGGAPEPERRLPIGGLGNAECSPGARQGQYANLCGRSEITERTRPWSASAVIYCRDGKWRRIPLEPAFQPLAAGVSAGRVGVLRGAGNAICPQVAAEFIKAVMEIR